MKDKKQLPYQQYLISLGKKYRELTKEELRHYQQLYNKVNREKLREYYIQYRKTPEWESKRKLYYAKGSTKERHRVWHRERYNNDSLYRRRVRVGQWLYQNMNRIKENKTNWIENVGCTKNEFITHIESQFVEGMSWDNWSHHGWHIDHIIPVSKGGTNHYTNLQPLWAKDNLSKSDKVPI